MSRNVEIFPNMRNTVLNLRDIYSLVSYDVHFLSWKVGNNDMKSASRQRLKMSTKSIILFLFQNVTNNLNETLIRSSWVTGVLQ
jgi:hypothetical protein